MISIYTTAFNIQKNQFDISSTLDNFSELADEICIATIDDNEDDTLNILKDLSKNNTKIDIIIDKSINSNTFAKDGKLKNLALQHCSNEICVQLDLDEMINDANIWKAFIHNNKHIIFDGHACMVPVINLYKHEDYYRDIGFKWYIHRKTGMFRGIVNFARISDTKFDKDKSDGCELIDANGNLISSFNLLSHPKFHNMSNLHALKNGNIPFVIHFGYVDLFRRAQINRNFWKKEWSEYIGEEVNITLNECEFKDEYMEHGLKL